MDLSNRSDLKSLFPGETNEPKYQLLIHNDEIQQRIEIIASRLNQKYKGVEPNKVVLLCSLKGAVYFFIDLTRKLTFFHTISFIQNTLHTSDCKEQSELVVKTLIDPDDFKDKIVIIVDELLTNGHSLMKFVDHMKTFDPSVIETCVLFQKGCKSSINVDYIGFQNLPDVWLVGYGIDDFQHKRNFPHLYAISKPSHIQQTLDDAEIFIY